MATTTRSRRLTAMLVAGVSLTFAACGDTGDGDEDAAAEEPNGEAPSGEATAGDCETVTVDIPEFAFEPDPVEIKACDSIVWSNSHSQPHTSTGNGEQTWSTGNIDSGESGEPVAFDDSGTFTYICALHPFMQGTVEVA